MRVINIKSGNKTFKDIELPPYMYIRDDIELFIEDETDCNNCEYELDFNGMTARCPCCDRKFTVAFDVATCEYCDWTAVELDELFVV